VSRIGKMPIAVPANVSASLSEDLILSVKGPKGELNKKFSGPVKINITNNEITIERDSDEKRSRAFHGLTRALVQNMVLGVTTGFQKKLEIVGVGYKAEVKGTKLQLTIGYSHPILVSVPQTLKITAPTPTEIIIEGIDKEMVGLVAAKIRSFRKPEPYKGKGIRYSGEHVRRKAGKTAGK